MVDEVTREPLTNIQQLRQAIAGMGRARSKMAGEQRLDPSMVKVVKVYDGDTVMAEFPDGTLERIRWSYGDAPETAKPGQKQEKNGVRARQALEESVLGKEVWFTPQGQISDDAYDRHGRMLGQLSLDKGRGQTETGGQFVEREGYYKDKGFWGNLGYSADATGASINRNAGGLLKQLAFGDENSALYKAGDALSKMATESQQGKTSPREPIEGTTSQKVMGWAGQLLGHPSILAGAMLESAPLMGAGAAGTIVAGPIGGIIASTAALSGNNYEDLTAAGVPHETAIFWGNASALGQAAVEQVSISRLGRIVKSGKTFLAGKLPAPLQGPVLSVLVGGLEDTGVGFAEETTQTIIGNAATRLSGARNAPGLTEGWLQSGVEGSILEGVMGRGAYGASRALGARPDYGIDDETGSRIANDAIQAAEKVSVEEAVKNARQAIDAAGATPEDKAVAHKALDELLEKYNKGELVPLSEKEVKPSNPVSPEQIDQLEPGEPAAADNRKPVPVPAQEESVDIDEAPALVGPTKPVQGADFGLTESEERHWSNVTQDSHGNVFFHGKDITALENDAVDKLYNLLGLQSKKEIQANSSQGAAVRNAKLAEIQKLADQRAEAESAQWETQYEQDTGESVDADYEDSVPKSRKTDYDPAKDRLRFDEYSPEEQKKIDHVLRLIHKAESQKSNITGTELRGTELQALRERASIDERGNVVFDDKIYEFDQKEQRSREDLESLDDTELADLAKQYGVNYDNMDMSQVSGDELAEAMRKHLIDGIRRRQNRLRVVNQTEVDTAPQEASDISEEDKQAARDIEREFEWNPFDQSADGEATSQGRGESQIYDISDELDENRDGRNANAESKGLSDTLIGRAEKEATEALNKGGGDKRFFTGIVRRIGDVLRRHRDTTRKGNRRSLAIEKEIAEILNTQFGKNSGVTKTQLLLLINRLNTVTNDWGKSQAFNSKEERLAWEAARDRFLKRGLRNGDKKGSPQYADHAAWALKRYVEKLGGNLGMPNYGLERYQQSQWAKRNDLDFSPESIEQGTYEYIKKKQVEGAWMYWVAKQGLKGPENKELRIRFLNKLADAFAARGIAMAEPYTVNERSGNPDTQQKLFQGARAIRLKVAAGVLKTLARDEKTEAARRPADRNAGHKPLFRKMGPPTEAEYSEQQQKKHENDPVGPPTKGEFLLRKAKAEYNIPPEKREGERIAYQPEKAVTEPQPKPATDQAVEAKVEQQHAEQVSKEQQAINKVEFMAALETILKDLGVKPSQKATINGDLDLVEGYWTALRDREIDIARDSKAVQEKFKEALGMKRYEPRNPSKVFEGKTLAEISFSVLLAIDIRKFTEFRKYLSKLDPRYVEAFELADRINKSLNESTETGKTLKKLKEVADLIIAQNDKAGDFAKSRGAIEAKETNYITHIWDFAKSRPKDGSRPFLKNPAQTMKRTLVDGIAEGLAKGYVLKVDEAVEAAFMARKYMSEAVANRALVKNGIKNNILVAEGDTIPFGYKLLEHPQMTIAEQTQSGIVQKKLYAPKKIATMLNNAFSLSKMQGFGPVDFLTRWNARLKRILLVGSLFHFRAFVWSSAMAGHGARSLNVARSYKEGKAAMEAMAPMLRRLIGAGLTLGHKLDYDPTYLRTKTAWGQEIERGKHVDAAWKMIDTGFARLEKFLFEDFGSALKAQSALVLTQHLLNKHKEALLDGTKTEEEIYSAVAERLNNDFGGIDYQRKGWNPTAIHAAKLGFLGYDWTISNIRSMYKAIKGGTITETEVHRMLWANVAVRWATGWVALNAMMAAADDDDFGERLMKAWRAGGFKFLDVDVTPLANKMGGNGQRKYLNIMGHFKDPIKFVFHPLKSARHKSSIIMNPAIEAILGKDYAQRPYTSLPELLKSGKTTSWASENEGGVLTPTQAPSFVINTGLGVLPITIQAIIGRVMGQMDNFDFTMNAIGMDSSTTYPKNFTKKKK